jgi:hypothetical protein
VSALQQNIRDAAIAAAAAADARAGDGRRVDPCLRLRQALHQLSGRRRRCSRRAGRSRGRNASSSWQHHWHARLSAVRADHCEHRQSALVTIAAAPSALTARTARWCSWLAGRRLGLLLLRLQWRLPPLPLPPPFVPAVAVLVVTLLLV